MSHRFKAFSPPFCAKNRVRLVPPENSAEIYFDRALNRRSQDGVPRAFYVTFCTTQKVTIRSLCREHRGSANLDSARRNGGFARTKLKPSQKKIRGFANLESAHTDNNFAQAQLNPFAAIGEHSQAASRPFIPDSAEWSFCRARHTHVPEKPLCSCRRSSPP